MRGWCTFFTFDSYPRMFIFRLGLCTAVLVPGLAYYTVNICFRQNMPVTPVYIYFFKKCPNFCCQMCGWGSLSVRLRFAQASTKRSPAYCTLVIDLCHITSIVWEIETFGLGTNVVVPVWWTNVGFPWIGNRYVEVWGVAQHSSCMQRCWFPQTLPMRQPSRCVSTVLTPD